MIIKTFVGDSSAAALKQVRAELGGDAVVLATRRVANTAGGYDTEVTACLDRPAPSTASASAASTIGTRRITKPVWNRMATKSTPQNTPASVTGRTTSTPKDVAADVDIELLRDLDIPKNIVIEITEATSEKSLLQDVLTNQIAARIGALPRFNAADRVLVLGPSGSGKTSIIAKLAAQFTAKKLTVTLTGFQQQKIGAVDELQSIADLVGIEYTDETVPVGTDQTSVTLIDCGTLDVTLEEVASLNATQTLFVVPATMRGADLREAIARMRGISVTGVCMTMLDQTRRLGSLFTVCDILNAPLTLVSTSAFGANSLIAPSAKALAIQMLGTGEKNA